MSKLTFKLMILTLCLSVAVVSCKKDKDKPDPTPPIDNNGGGDGGGNGNGDGEPYVKNFSFIASTSTATDSMDFTKDATISFSSISSNVNKIVLFGKSGTTFPIRSLRIQFPDTLRINHTYNMNSAVASQLIPINYTVQSNSNTTDKYSAQGGSFTLDSINTADKYVKGHFSVTVFSGPSQVQLKVGKFELKE